MPTKKEMWAKAVAIAEQWCKENKFYCEVYYESGEDSMYEVRESKMGLDQKYIRFSFDADGRALMLGMYNSDASRLTPLSRIKVSELSEALMMIKQPLEAALEYANAHPWKPRGPTMRFREQMLK